MTAIAWDGTTLASDSRCTQGGIIVDQVQKVFRLKDGSIMAGAGDVEEVDMVRAWIDLGCPAGDKPTVSDIEIIHVRIDGSVWICLDKCAWRKHNHPFAGAGSGANLVRMALRVGKQAAEAVSLACEFDIDSGGDIQAMTLDNAVIRDRVAT